MGTETAIGWTDHTFNPWWGCERVSPGCQHCYAEAFAKRTGHAVWGKTADRRMFGDKHWSEPLRWNAAAESAGRRALVFCASMADVFEDRPELDEPRARLFELIAETPSLIWQLLTKRPENIARMMLPAFGTWLPSNVWLGTTVEDQRRTDRLEHLCAIPARVRFVSAEPLLGPVDLRPWLDRLEWVIVGGESGPGHRPMRVADAVNLCDDVIAAGVPLFFKQWGGRTPTAGGDLIALGDAGELRPIKQFPPVAGSR